MQHLHLFNPENDLALAAGTVNYTPPRVAAELHRQGAWLPIWYAEPGDRFYAPDFNIHTAERINRQYGMDVWPGCEGIPSPWGWSEHAVNQYRKIGIEGPFPDNLQELRQLSHRRTITLLHHHLQEANLPYPIPKSAIEINSVSNLPPGSDYFLKSPWSCSGRGVTDCRNLSADAIRRQADNIIRRQGSVMLEPALGKVQDFALLFYSDGAGKISFSGISLFYNSDAKAAYSGNLVASQDHIRRQLNAPYLDRTIEAVCAALTDIVGSKYSGPLGVDMLTYRSANGKIYIAPTIEINLRMTMGYVALRMSRFITKPHIFTLLRWLK